MAVTSTIRIGSKFGTVNSGYGANRGIWMDNGTGDQTLKLNRMQKVNQDSV